MSKYNIYPLFECQNRHLDVNLRYLASVRVSKWEFECLMNVELRYLASVRVSKWEFERLNVIFSFSSHVKIRY